MAKRALANVRLQLVKGQRGKKSIIYLTWVLITAFVVIAVVVRMTDSLNNHDKSVEADLNNLTTHLISAGPSAQPASLANLKVEHLHYSIGTYSYSAHQNDPQSWQYAQADQIYSGFQICGRFDTQGLAVKSSESYSQPTVFEHHVKGKQCFQYYFAEYSIGDASIRPVK